MQLCLIRRNAGLLALLVIPVVCLSMGGCPPTGGGNPVCGNGSVESGEECDDGNTTAGDGCSASCQDEGGTCGDGTVDAGEECDDGNTTDGDGCSSTCEDEGSTTPADDDGDGVRNEIDECPGTARGTEVNDVGCPEGAPADDADNDGVTNVNDDCANTPAGATVDANGCASNQLDTDGDGVFDNVDACERTPEAVQVDEVGCPLSTDPQDDDEDGIPNDIDQCEGTVAAAQVDSNGCSAVQRDTDEDGLNDEVDQCPTQAGPLPTGCPGGGGGPVCGNGTMEAGEQCDDHNTVSGDGCSSTCQTEGSGIANDNCADATAIGEGTQVYSNVGATTDGPLEPDTETVEGGCTFFSNTDIRSDLWYCYTATCAGPVVVSLCGSGYDTKMAVYSGCECPSPDIAVDRPIACSDDDCGTGTENAQSRVTITAVAGQSYLVRVGGFLVNQGEGRLTILCGGDTCLGGTGSCTTGHLDNEPGCENATCCNRVCEVDTFCCDVTWDAFCASQAEGFCSTTGFPSCNADADGCDVDQTSPGCNDGECCNAVCETDPFCCIREWDENCVDQAGLICASCGRGRGECNEVRTEPGCNDISCCATVCAVDPFCCNSEWDSACVEQAADLCGR